MNVNELCREDLIAVIKEHPYLIKYLDVQDPEICKVALEANYHVLCLIRKQTEELCLFAVKQLAYIRKQTPAIIKAAIQQSSDAEYYVDRA